MIVIGSMIVLCNILQEGVFDMDYHFRFAPRGGARVSVKEYRDWRSTGTAFRFGESNSGEIISIILHKTIYRMKPNLGLILSELLVGLK